MTVVSHVIEYLGIATALRGCLLDHLGSSSASMRIVRGPKVFGEISWTARKFSKAIPLSTLQNNDLPRPFPGQTTGIDRATKSASDDDGLDEILHFAVSPRMRLHRVMTAHISCSGRTGFP